MCVCTEFGRVLGQVCVHVILDVYHVTPLSPTHVNSYHVNGKGIPDAWCKEASLGGLGFPKCPCPLFQPIGGDVHACLLYSSACACKQKERCCKVGGETQGRKYRGRGLGTCRHAPEGRASPTWGGKLSLCLRALMKATMGMCVQNAVEEEMSSSRRRHRCLRAGGESPCPMPCAPRLPAVPPQKHACRGWPAASSSQVFLLPFSFSSMVCHPSKAVHAVHVTVCMQCPLEEVQCLSCMQN